MSTSHDAADPVLPDGVGGVSAAGDPVVTLSEQRLTVGTEWVVSGRLRLRRRIVSERRTVEIEVRREVLELAGETIDFHEGLLVGTAIAGAAVEPPADRPPFVAVLREEVPVVSFGVQPYEQVTVTTTRVQQAAVVTDTVARERVAVDVQEQRHPPPAE